jgi:type IV secretory pathway VirB6-like protein
VNKIKVALLSVVALIGVVSFVPSYTVLADAAGDITTGINDVGGNEGGNATSLGSRIQTVVNILLYILGAIAVVMIVIGGVRYTTSNGDSSAIKGAKDTILYAVIGLIVAIMAYAIVNFVVGAF